MKKQITLTVRTPCHEKWGNMTPDGNGRHCSCCNKTVIDFSDFTDKELIAFLKNNRKGCGRFDQSQLNRAILIPAENNNSFFHKAIVGAALVTGIAATAEGQTTQYIPPAHVVIPALTAQNSTKRETEQTHAATEKHMLHGIVINSKTKEPLEYASIEITGIDSVFQCDTTGRFTIELPSGMSGKTITMKISSGWYKDKEVKISARKQSRDRTIPLKRKKYVMMGAWGY